MQQSHLGGIIMASAAMLLLTGPVQAQFPVNVAAGPTFANISTDDFDTSMKTGFFAAVGTSFQAGESFAIQPWVAYVQKGAKFDSNSGEDTYSYIEIPVFVSFGVPLSESVGLGLSAGPQIAFLMTCTESVPGVADYDCKDYNDYDGSTEFGLVGAASLQFPLGNSSLSVGLGYDLGLTDIFTDINGGYKNRVIYLFGGYGFSLGGM